MTRKTQEMTKAEVEAIADGVLPRNFSIFAIFETGQGNIRTGQGFACKSQICAFGRQ